MQCLYSHASAQNQDAAGTQSEAAQAEQPSPEKLELARDLEKLRPAWEELNAVIRRMSRQFPQNRRFAFIVAMERTIDRDAVEEAAVNAMVETFTEDELRALVEFYSNENIRSGMAKLDTYREKLNPVVSRIVDEALMKLRKSPGSEKLKQP